MEDEETLLFEERLGAARLLVHVLHLLEHRVQHLREVLARALQTLLSSFGFSRELRRLSSSTVTLCNHNENFRILKAIMGELTA